MVRPMAPKKKTNPVVAAAAAASATKKTKKKVGVILSAAAVVVVALLLFRYYTYLYYHVLVDSSGSTTTTTADAATKGGGARAATADAAADKNGSGRDRRRRRGQDRLPEWAAKYFRWHGVRRKLINAGDGGKDFRFLVLTCAQSDRTCGGLSDRLKSLPLLLLLAAKTERVFLIYWDRPCRLEEFLVPPLAAAADSSLDWRTPDWLAARIRRGDGRKSGRAYTTADAIVKAAERRDAPLIAVRLQDQNGGAAYYDERVGGEGAHHNAYGALFRALFEPSAPLAAALDEERKLAGLQPGRYVAAHLRALYVPPLPKEIVPNVAVNAVDCASQLGSDASVPIYFASDSKYALDVVKSYGQNRSKTRSIITIDRGGRDPLHLDKAKSRNAKDYYDAFLDLYHFADAQCVSHGQGGFGRLGVLLSHNASCYKPFIAQSRIVECEWRDGS